MSTDGRQPSPEFDSTRYERPQKDWVCGHACEGCPCRLGPGPGGTCRAGPECKPFLVKPEGEAKGLWKCTRPADWGGPCAEGPRPDGTCCRSTPPCVPVRSLRSRRGLLVRATIAACLGFVLLALFGPWRHVALNPAPLSRVHSGPHFAGRDAAGVVDANGCAQCHPAAHQSPADWVATTLEATSAGPLNLDKLLSTDARDFKTMDAACQSCHPPHSFHQASIATATSCSVCHREHRGLAQDLRAVDPAHCAACHGDNQQMNAAGLLARSLDPALFSKQLPAGHTAFRVARPPEGLTSRITAFATDHPEFRAKLPGVRDPNSLAFNHSLHLNSPTIPLVDGQPLDCRSCHVPESTGNLMKPVSFALHCKSCHALPIDPETPALVVPHGSPEAVRAFLRTLPVAYSDDAVRYLRLSGEPLRAYVTEKLAALHARQPSGEALERQVFFGDPAPPAGRDSCNLCHIVQASPGGAAPLIAPVQIPTTWLPRARFNHARHTQMACTDCHAAQTSTQTADVLLPSQKSCATCHGPAGGVTDACTACHGYHNPPPTGLPTPPLADAPLPHALQRALAVAAP